MLIMPGVRAEMTFYKGLLDKLGLQFDALQMGKYKGAAEPLTRNEMSKPLRESLDALVDDTYDDLVATIAADRQLKDYQVKTLMDQGLFTAAAAKKAGLIDEVLYADQLQETPSRRQLKAEDVNVVTDYKKKHDRHRLLRHLRHDEVHGAVAWAASRRQAAGKKPKIAVVYAVGPDHGRQERAATSSATRRWARPPSSPPCARPPTTPRWRPSCCGSTAPAARPRPAT